MTDLRGFLLSALCIFLLWSCKDNLSDNTVFPSPETAIVDEDDEEGDHQLELKNWIELMHGGENSGWRVVEADNQQKFYTAWLQKSVNLRSQDEIVAGGFLRGIWLERGSNNNAGNIMVVDYDVRDDEIYAVGGGGPMFKGDFSGFGWEVVNDKLRFSTNLLKVFHLTGGKTRIVSAVNGIPHFSDDEGKTWTKSTGVTPTLDGWNLYHSQVTSDGKIFFLGKRDYGANIKVYASFDYGVTYKSLKLFATSDTRNIALARNGVNDDIFVIEQTNIATSNLYKYNKNAASLEILQADSPIGFGEEGRANLQAITYKDTTRLYLFNNDKKLYSSNNLGKSWKFVSTLPSSPWDVGLYVCPSDPTKMLFGEVNAYKTVTAGINWYKTSEWWQYYGDIYSKLHADIMTIKEFKDQDGNPFLLNGNHGGLYYSTDYGETHTNIGLYNLNVSQYYDVRSYPSDPYYIFAGSQDQGQQKGYINGEETSELIQNISGDYGHIIFTGNGKSLWSVYPGGSIGFYSEPLLQNSPVAGYEIKSQNESVWIPPIISGPNPSENIVYAAGGSVNESSAGSYILKLEYKNGNITASQLPFNFAGSGGQISAMAFDPVNKNIWYVATTNGKFYKSTDNAQNFTKTSEFLSEAHYLYGSCILPSAANPGVVYLSGNGYNYKPVYRSLNGGLTFSDFSNGLPKTMVFNIAANEDESLIFAATEAGPYVYISDKARWYELNGQQTPNQTYWSVEYIPQIKTARFATYGRGVWDFQVKDILTGTKNEIEFKSSLTVYPNPASDFIRISGDEDFLFGRFTLYNPSGNVVLSQPAIPGIPISINHLPVGVYTAELNYSKNKKALKLLIQR
jgi:hypothetical protein